MTAHKILFVCLGNICRSPSAEGAFTNMVNQRSLEKRFFVDSAGTAGWHTGNPPDERAQQAAAKRGIDISGLRARQVTSSDLVEFDTIIAMDQDNLRALKAMAPEAHQHKIRLLRRVTDAVAQRDVPDPYYGGDEGFETTLDIIEQECDLLLGSLLHR